MRDLKPHAHGREVKVRTGLEHVHHAELVSRAEGEEVTGAGYPRRSELDQQ